ncbi:MAG: hypothetical protein JXR63_00755 [Spirochaetales bacterium]|nr:hypothetical protein [Spirochaetales bacterium]
MASIFQFQTLESLTNNLDAEMKSLIYLLIPYDEAVSIYNNMSNQQLEAFVDGSIKLFSTIPDADELEQLKIYLGSVINEINWFLEKKKNGKILSLPLEDKLLSALLEFDLEKAHQFLDMIKTKNKNLFFSIRKRICLFDELIYLSPKSIQRFVKQIDPVVLAMALKGSSKKIQDLVLSNMEEDSAGYLKEEMMFVDSGMLGQIEMAQRQCQSALAEMITLGDLDIPQNLL